jgi:hypothetical protein
MLDAGAASASIDILTVYSAQCVGDGTDRSAKQDALECNEQLRVVVLQVCGFEVDGT